MESPPGNFSPPWKSRHSSLQMQRDTNSFGSPTYLKCNCLGLKVQITFTIFLSILNMGFFSLAFLLLLWGCCCFCCWWWWWWVFFCCCFLFFVFVVVAFVVVVFVFVCVCVSGGPIMLKQNQDLELCNDNCWNLVKHHNNNNNKNYFTTDHKKKSVVCFLAFQRLVQSSKPAHETMDTKL